MPGIILLVVKYLHEKKTFNTVWFYNTIHSGLLKCKIPSILSEKKAGEMVQATVKKCIVKLERNKGNKSL